MDHTRQLAMVTKERNMLQFASRMLLVVEERNHEDKAQSTSRSLPTGFTRTFTSSSRTPKHIKQLFRSIQYLRVRLLATTLAMGVGCHISRVDRLASMRIEVAVV